jgi:hypothetical protein
MNPLIPLFVVVPLAGLPEMILDRFLKISTVYISLSFSSLSYEPRCNNHAGGEISFYKVGDGSL